MYSSSRGMVCTWCMAWVSCTVLWCPSSTVEAASCLAEACPGGGWSPKVRVLIVWVVLNDSSATWQKKNIRTQEKTKRKGERVSQSYRKQKKGEQWPVSFSIGFVSSPFAKCCKKIPIQHKTKQKQKKGKCFSTWYVLRALLLLLPHFNSNPK